MGGEGGKRRRIGGVKHVVREVGLSNEVSLDAWERKLVGGEYLSREN